MLPNVVNGLPLHILLVHVVVIVLPAAALLTVLGALWPAFRQKLGVLTPVVALIGLVSVPLATNAGEWLLQRVAPTPLVQAHVALGDTLLPWAIGQFVVATAIWVWYRWFEALRVPRSRAAASSGSASRSPAAASSTSASRASAASPAAGPSAAPPPVTTAPGSAVGAGAGAGVGAGAARRAPDGTVLLQGTDPYAPVAGAATPGIRPTAPPRARAGRRASLAVSIAAIVVALVVSTGTVAKVVQIGESGSSAVWQGSFSSDPLTN